MLALYERDGEQEVQAALLKSEAVPDGQYMMFGWEWCTAGVLPMSAPSAREAARNLRRFMSNVCDAASHCVCAS